MTGINLVVSVVAVIWMALGVRSAWAMYHDERGADWVVFDFLIVTGVLVALATSLRYVRMEE